MIVRHRKMCALRVTLPRPDGRVSISKALRDAQRRKHGFYRENCAAQKRKYNEREERVLAK